MYEFIIKRLFDLLLAALLIIMATPILILVLLIVWIIIKQPPIIVQERSITLDKNQIKILKIRTIKSTFRDRELKKKSNNIFLKNELRDYVPAFCRLLRKTGFDEFLQLLSVIKGDMSIVGPRPLMVDDLISMKINAGNSYEKRKKIRSKPGITGCWQVWGDRKLGEKNLLYCDQFYDNNKSIHFDLVILLETLLIFFTASPLRFNMQ